MSRLASPPVPSPATFMPWRDKQMTYPTSSHTARRVHSDATTAAASSVRTLPVSLGLLSDAEARESVPFSAAVNADSYRAHMLVRRHEAAAAAAAAAALPAAFVLPPPHCASFVHRSSVLGPADLAHLTDALLCNTSLTSLALDHCGLDSHSCDALSNLLAQHPTLTSLSLEGNRLGAHPDSGEMRALFQTLASKPLMPNLMHINLANKSKIDRMQQCGK